jgi:hypothetical protein
MRLSICFALILFGLTNRAFAADNSTTLGSATLQPGDIVNFVGGDAAIIGNGRKYGHTALYLGRHSDTEIPYFLDFQTADYGSLKLPSQQNLEELYYHRDPKRQIDIFRPKFKVDVEKLQIAAARLVPDKYFASIHHWKVIVCSQAAFDVLKASTDAAIRNYSGEVVPNSYSPGGNVGTFFEKVNSQPITISPADFDKAASADTDSSYLSRVAEDSSKIIALEQSYWATQNEIRNPGHTADLADVEKSRETGWLYFRATIRYACADPDGFEATAKSHDAYGVVFSYEVMSDSYYRDQASLSACDRGLIEPMIAARTPLSYGWLVKQARAYRQKIEKQARKEAKARQRAIEQEQEAEEAQREYSRSTDSLTEHSNSSSRIHNSEGLAYSQLVGIAGGQLSFDGR